MRRSCQLRRLFVENLECRRLLAADLDGGVLTIDGTNKSDRISVSLVNTDVNVTLNKQTFTFVATDVTSIEINGGNGNDWISIDGGVSQDAIIDGGAGNDRITGGDGDDTILGDKGNDRLHGGGGNDTIVAGAGNDWAWGDLGDDVVHGNGGNDHLFGGFGLDQLFGDAGHDALAGNDDDDQLFGGAGHDRLRGGAGNDELFGEGGKDHLYGESGDDLLDGGDANDKLWGGDGNDVIKGGAGADHLNGGAGDNLLDGDTGKNHFKNGFVVELDQELVATLTSATSAAVGVATYKHVIENGAVEVQLTIAVDNWPIDPVTPVPVVLDVTVSGQATPIGQITVGVDGHGSVVFSTSPDGDQLSFPVPFTLAAGSTITVGTDLTGSFVAAFA